MHPKVSIILPNYNHACFLEERLDSIFSQTFQDYEVILLDDCSTDNSLDILKKYENHPKVKGLYVNKENSGSPFKQWKKGIELAHGEYIWIAESDDVAAESFLEKMIAPFYIHADVGLVYCRSLKIDDESNAIGFCCVVPRGMSFSRWEHDYLNNGNDEINNYLLYNSTITNASSVLVRRRLISNVVVPDKFRLAGDWFTWLNVLLNCDIYYLAETLNYFRYSAQCTRVYDDFALLRERMSENLEVLNYFRQKRLISFKRYSRAVSDRMHSWENQLYWQSKSLKELFEFTNYLNAMPKFFQLYIRLQLFIIFFRNKFQFRSRLKQWFMQKM
jgi:glycosyltransferase involved in cell wall biosynthesis